MIMQENCLNCNFTDRVMCFIDNAIAYSATTVLPAEVCAATKTLSCFSRCKIACFWKTSGSNGHCNHKSLNNNSKQLQYISLAMKGGDLVLDLSRWVFVQGNWTSWTCLEICLLHNEKKFKDSRWTTVWHLGLTVWNSLPLSHKNVSMINTFKFHLKTRLVKKYLAQSRVLFSSLFIYALSLCLPWCHLFAVDYGFLYFYGWLFICKLLHKNRAMHFTNRIIMIIIITIIYRHHTLRNARLPYKPCLVPACRSHLQVSVHPPWWPTFPVSQSPSLPGCWQSLALLPPGQTHECLNPTWNTWFSLQTYSAYKNAKIESEVQACNWNVLECIVLSN